MITKSEPTVKMIAIPSTVNVVIQSSVPTISADYTYACRPWGGGPNIELPPRTNGKPIAYCIIPYYS